MSSLSPFSGYEPKPHLSITIKSSFSSFTTVSDTTRASSKTLFDTIQYFSKNIPNRLAKMDKLNFFFEDFPSLSLHDISHRVTKEIVRFSNSARIPSPTNSPSILSPAPGTEWNNEDFDNENSIIDLIEHANTSTREKFSHHLAWSSASETNSESPSHHDQNSSSKDTEIPVPLPEHMPPTMSNRVSSHNALRLPKRP